MGTGYRAVRLPYGGGKLAMVIFLPDHDSSPAKLLQSLNGDTWPRVSMPGFTERNDYIYGHCERALTDVPDVAGSCTPPSLLILTFLFSFDRLIAC